MEKFEINLFKEQLPLKSNPRLFYDDNESSHFLRAVYNYENYVISKDKYETYEEILNSILKKNEEKNINPQKKKLYFLNNIVKYMKIAVRFCFEGDNL